MLVVILHASSSYVKTAAISQNLSFDFVIANVFDSFSRICVPLFVLISGRFLLGRQESPGSFYRKRSSRILIPLISWSFIYMLYSILGSYFFNGSWEVEPIVEALINGRPFYHLWYLYMLIGMYAITPVLNFLMSRISGKSVKLMASGFLVIGFILDLMVYRLGMEVPFPFWPVFYVGYFMWGYLLKESRSIAPSILILIYISSSIFIVVLTHMTVKSGSFYFYNYLSPFVIFGALAVYKLFDQLNLKSNFLSRMASLSFGIYLVHAGILDALNKLLSLSGITIFSHPALGIPFKFLLVFPLSALISYLILRIKYIRKTI